MIYIKYHNESFVQIECDYDDAMNISEVFCFYAENYHFSPKYKAGFWDGKIRLFDVNTQLLPYGLTRKLVKWLKVNNYDFKVDKRIFKLGEKISRTDVIDFSNHIKSIYDPMDFQIDAVRYFIRYKKMLGLSATSSGKSFIYYLFINFLRMMYEDMKILLLVPRTSLVEQMSGDFIQYAKDWCGFKKYIHKIYAGKEKYTDKLITVSTWQSLQNMPPEYFQKFNCLIVDEVHTAKAKEISRIINNSVNTVYRIGMTGHLQDSKIDRLQLEAMFGRKKIFSKSSELIERNIISDIKIKSYILKHKKEVCEAWKTFYNNKDRGSTEAYKYEIDLIRGEKKRIKFLLKLAATRKKNTMVLFKGIDYGRKLYEIAKKNMNKEIYYVDGSINTQTREKFRILTEKRNDVIIFASFGTFSTGINIKNLHNLIFAESMLSSIQVIQSIGRILRKFENKEAILYDIVDDMRIDKKLKNYVLKHFLKRIKYYEKEGFIYDVKEVNLYR